MTPEDRGVLAYMIERIGKAVDQRVFAPKWTPDPPVTATVTGIRHAPLCNLVRWGGGDPPEIRVSGSQLLVLFRTVPTSRESLALPEDVEVAP